MTNNNDLRIFKGWLKQIIENSENIDDKILRCSKNHANSIYYRTNEALNILNEKKYNFTQNKYNLIILKIINFIKLYNNNYRPIYHLESFLYYLCKVVNEL